MRAKGYNLKFIVIVGNNDSAFEMAEKIRENKQLGYKILGIFSEVELNKDDFKLLGNYSELNNYLSLNTVDEVIISLDYEDYPQLYDIIISCEKNGVKSSVLPFYTKYFPSKPFVEEFEGVQLINLRKIPLDNFINKLVKRTFDIIISFILLLVLLPLLIFIAIGVKFTSKGKLIYKQERVGLNKKLFTMYKFRSMKDISNDTHNNEWSCKNDPRRTKFGAFIRKYSLDELPQLFNVLKGDMSLVGPRPEIPYHVNNFQQSIPRYMVKHQVRPGMTGWAQVNGWRGDTSIEERIKCDIFYIENQSFLFDIKILFMTAVMGFVSKQE